ncbi:MAG: bifunctional (p)ppGpp synthetase/guanosine-3',5'-bis(diphosphate) 3'-pyrophosphohydrolase, partial [Clostridia bacterium]|nr:bifunctional (p)ppGpp synthetase/guanosine-3',5'-bis(diphosphate) 3'-pyrophosphohydrolase [Clostridia bacterium]
MEELNRMHQELLQALRSSGRDYDIEKIDLAYLFANEAHKDQKRLSGEPYMIHPVAVANQLVDLGMDSESVIAGLLHDVVEDTPVELAEIRAKFGKEVANLIDGLTKIEKIPFASREEEQAENVRKMLIAMAGDIRVIIIKLADRVHNMSTMQFQTPQKQRDKSRESMEVYAPIAHRLGIRGVKEYLEDTSLRYLDPVAYKEIEEALATFTSDREEFIKKTKQEIQERLAQHIPNGHITGRVKSVHGIYRKMFLQGKSIDEVFDIFAVRVIVDSVNDCYNVLGIIHDMFRPLPNRFKDYISTPKANMYQSLHTTVMGKDGIPFEVQIRTWEMHQTAEYGIAAHWKYKLGLGKGSDSMDQRVAWIRQVLDGQEGDATDVVNTIKSDLAAEDVYVFTPKGDVISLPMGSNVIDVAYAIHSAVGNRMIGAKVDKRIVSLDYQVKTGEIVEILTTKEAGHGPSRDWLNMVKTSEARNKIRTWFKKERREENIAEGKEIVVREFKRNSIEMLPELITLMVETIGRRNGSNT